MGWSWIFWNRNFPLEFSVFLWNKQSQEMLFCWTYRLVMNLLKAYKHFLRILLFGFFVNATLIGWYFLKSVPSDNMKQITIFPSKDFVPNKKHSQGSWGTYVTGFQKDSCSLHLINVWLLSVCAFFMVAVVWSSSLARGNSGGRSWKTTTALFPCRAYFSNPRYF